jgi:hypothetical protein
MSLAAEKLPLPHRDDRKQNRAAIATRWLINLSPPRRCRDVFEKNVQILLPRLYWTRNIGTRPLD